MTTTPRKPGAHRRILLHGWALSATVWDDLLPLLAPGSHALDLAGHGRRADEGRLGTIDEAADDVAARLPRGCDLVGWSLGGLIALAAAARHPGRVGWLTLVAVSPRFVRAGDWTHAVEAGALNGMKEGIATNRKATLARFLAQQFHGVEGGSDGLRRLRARLEAQPPAPQALDDGLDILAHTDLREEFARLPLPVTVILGARDTFTPRGVAGELAALRPDARIVTIPHAGHAPFLSHPHEFISALDDASHG